MLWLNQDLTDYHRCCICGRSEAEVEELLVCVREPRLRECLDCGLGLPAPEDE